MNWQNIPKADKIFIVFCVFATVTILTYGYSIHTGERGLLSEATEEFNIDVIKKMEINGTPRNVVVLKICGSYSSKGDITAGRKVKIEISGGDLLIHKEYAPFLNEPYWTMLFIENSKPLGFNKNMAYINVFVVPEVNQCPNGSFWKYRLEKTDGEVIFKSNGIFGAEFRTKIPIEKSERFTYPDLETEKFFKIGSFFIGAQLEHYALITKITLITIWIGIIGVANIVLTRWNELEDK